MLFIRFFSGLSYIFKHKINFLDTLIIKLYFIILIEVKFLYKLVDSHCLIRNLKFKKRQMF